MFGLSIGNGHRLVHLVSQACQVLRNYTSRKTLTTAVTTATWSPGSTTRLGVNSLLFPSTSDDSGASSFMRFDADGPSDVINLCSYSPGKILDAKMCEGARTQIGCRLGRLVDLRVCARVSCSFPSRGARPPYTRHARDPDLIVAIGPCHFD